MTRRRRLSCAAALATAVVVALGATGGQAATRIDGQAATSITLGIAAPIPMYAFPTYAKNKGYFPRSIDVDVRFTSSPVLNPLLAGGQVQFGLAGSPNFELLAAGGAPVSYLATYGTFTDFQVVACCNINSVADLKGKTIGITGPGTLGALLTNVILARARLATDDFKVAALGTLGAMVGALQTGRINALLSSPPIPQQLAADVPGARIIYDMSTPARRLDWLNGAIAGHMPWVRSHPAATVALLRGLNRAIVNWPKDPVGAKRAIREYTGTTDPAALDQAYRFTLRSYRAIPRPGTLFPVALHTLRNTLAIARVNGFSQATADVAPKLTTRVYICKVVPKAVGCPKPKKKR